MGSNIIMTASGAMIVFSSSQMCAGKYAILSVVNPSVTIGMLHFISYLSCKYIIAFKSLPPESCVSHIYCIFYLVQSHMEFFFNYVIYSEAANGQH